MSKIFRNSETKEIENFLSTSEKVSPELKSIIQEELQTKGKRYKDSFIWLISENDKIVIDVFNIKGEVFETDSFYYTDYINL